MGFPPASYILIPASFVLFFRGRRSLLGAAIVFAVINVSLVNVGVTTLTAFQLFAGFFILRSVFDSVLSETRGIHLTKANGWLALFLFLCVASLSMTVLQAGDVQVFTERSQGAWLGIESYQVPLKLRPFNFTQLLYPLFGGIFFHFLVREFRTIDDLRWAMRTFLRGVLIIAAMTLGAGFLYTFGLGTLYETIWGFFRISTEAYKEPWAGAFGRFFRVYTPAGEPGATGQTVLAGLAIVSGSVLFSERGSAVTRGRWWKLGLLATALLLSGSTSAYLGAGLLLMWVVGLSWYIGSVPSRGILYLLGAMSVVGVLGVFVQVSGMSFFEWLREYHAAKFQREAGSGKIRIFVTWYTLREVFLASPILGVGYGSHLSLSFATGLLANIGLLGFGVFLGFLLTVFRNAKTVVESAIFPLRSIASVALLGFVAFISMSLVTQSTAALNNGVTWIVIALPEAAYQVYKRQLTHQGA